MALIPTIAWADLKFYWDPPRAAPPNLYRPGARHWHRLRFSQEQVVTNWPAPKAEMIDEANAVPTSPDQSPPAADDQPHVVEDVPTETAGVPTSDEGSPIQAPNTGRTSRREERKRETVEKYRLWNKEAQRIKKASKVAWTDCQKAATNF